MIPIIKWTGSKRSQSKRIIQLFPKNINTDEVYIGNYPLRRIGFIPKKLF